MLTCREISQRLWCGDYKLLVKDALEADPEMAATCRTHLESNNAHYKRRLQKHSDPSALEVYVEKEDLRIAEWLSELDGASSQKCKTPFKEAKGIQAKIVRTGVAATGAASYEGENRPLRIGLSFPQLFFDLVDMIISMAASLDVQHLCAAEWSAAEWSAACGTQLLSAEWLLPVL